MPELPEHPNLVVIITDQERTPMARTAAGRLPSTLPSRTIARKNAGSSLADRLMAVLRLRQA